LHRGAKNPFACQGKDGCVRRRRHIRPTMPHWGPICPLTGVQHPYEICRLDIMGVLLLFGILHQSRKSKKRNRAVPELGTDVSF